MYPESLRKVRVVDDDGFLDYCKQGKRAYAIAAEIEGGEDRPPCQLLHQLSEQFELCAYGLREIRREWEEGENENDDDSDNDSDDLFERLFGFDGDDERYATEGLGFGD